MKRLLVVLLLFSAAAAAQEPIRVSVCDLKANPLRYNHQLVELRAQVLLEFEGQEVSDEHCAEFNNENSVWITFGGDVSDPAVYCCGSHARQPGDKFTVEGIEIPVEKDALFTRLLKDAAAYRRNPVAKKGSDDEFPGRFYDVTATVIGRFFAGNQDHTRQIDMPGYGHMGCCTLLAIQKVVSIDQEVPRGQPGEWKCSHNDWQAPEDEASIRHQHAAIPLSDTWRFTDADRVADATLGDLRHLWGDSKAGRFSKCKIENYDNRATHSRDKKATCDWSSDDGMESYQIQLWKYGYLQHGPHSLDRIAWLPDWAAHNSCVVP